MKKFTFLLLIVVMYSGSALYSQSISADTLKSLMLQDWQRAKAYTDDYLATMPAEKYSLKATDSVRSFAQQMLHLGQTNLFFLSLIKGEKPDFSAPQWEHSASAQSADLVKYYVDYGYDAIINLVKGMSAADYVNKSTMAMEQPYTAYNFVWLAKAFEHQTHHRGQTTIYLRLAGVKPPQERLF